MPRTTPAADGKVLPILLAIVAVALLAALVLVLRGGDFAKLESFPAVEFLEGPEDFLGNEYSLRAQIDAQLKYEQAVGRLVAVVPEGGRTRLPVFVPARTGGNLHVGQRYEMRVRVDDGGLIYVEDLRKF